MLVSKVRWILLVICSLGLGFAAGAKSKVLDRPVPWPWGLEQPFPWNEIQGTWRLAEDGVPPFYFSFKVVHPSEGVTRLVVNQIDAVQCKVIATGIGYEIHRVLRAQMRSVAGVTYRLSLRAFKQEDSPQPIIGQETSQVMVLSMSKLDGSNGAQNLHIQIGKTSAKPDFKSCTEEK